MDLQAASNGENIGDDENATALIRRDHQALRKAFVQYRESMDGAATQRAALAQDISMQLELHFTITRDIFYPAVAPTAPELVDDLNRAQEDVLECAAVLRTASPGDEAELDSTMVRLMELCDVYICKERRLLETSAGDPAALQRLGAEMVDRRKEIAGSVDDLESRS